MLEFEHWYIKFTRYLLVKFTTTMCVEVQCEQFVIIYMLQNISLINPLSTFEFFLEHHRRCFPSLTCISVTHESIIL